MSDGIVAEATYVCTSCGHEHNLKQDEITFEAEAVSERGMGEENHYAAYVDLPCDNCDQEIHLRFEVWEYPTGIINYNNHEASGAEILDVDFNIYHRPPVLEEESDDNSRVLGAAAGVAIFGASVGGLFGAVLGGLIGGLIGDSVKKGGKGNG